MLVFNYICPTILPIDFKQFNIKIYIWPKIVKTPYLSFSYKLVSTMLQFYH